MNLAADQSIHIHDLLRRAPTGLREGISGPFHGPDQILFKADCPLIDIRGQVPARECLPLIQGNFNARSG